MPFCSPQLFDDGKLYMVKSGGMLTCVDARTGEVFFQEERIGALGDYYASLMAADGKICLVSHSGIAVVLKAGSKLEILSRNELKEPVATPAIVSGQIIVRTANHLYSFGTTESVELTLVE